MSYETMIAKLSTPTPSLSPGIGGMPEVTPPDIAAALGFIEKSECSKLGEYASEAAYADDAIAKHELEQTLPRKIWVTWFEMDIQTALRRRQVETMAKAMILEIVQPGKFRDMPASELAKACKMDYRTWQNGHGKVYNRVMDDIRNAESRIRRKFRL